MNVSIKQSRPETTKGKVTIFGVSQKVLTAVSRREKNCWIFGRKVKGIKTLQSEELGRHVAVCRRHRDEKWYYTFCPFLRFNDGFRETTATTSLKLHYPNNACFQMSVCLLLHFENSELSVHLGSGQEDYRLGLNWRICSICWMNTAADSSNSSCLDELDAFSWVARS